MSDIPFILKHLQTDFVPPNSVSYEMDIEIDVFEEDANKIAGGYFKEGVYHDLLFKDLPKLLTEEYNNPGSTPPTTSITTPFWVYIIDGKILVSATSRINRST